MKNAAGANNDVFNRTGQAALDMAAALGKGTVTADGLANTTKILGKAMEDPTKAAGGAAPVRDRPDQAAAGRDQDHGRA